MKDKIKKILDDKTVIIDQHWNYIIIGNEKYYDLPKRLLDYITNLQEKNERQKENLLNLNKTIKKVKKYNKNLNEYSEYTFDEYLNYRQRNEKAIEKINDLIEVEKKETDYDRFFGDNDYTIKKLNDIKNTLQGEYKDE